MKRKNFLAIFVIAFLIVMAACSSDENVDEAASGEDSEGSEKTGDLTIGTMAEMVTTDPHGSNDSASRQVRANIYETLVFQDVDMSLSPGLATEYEQVDETT